MTYNRDIVKIEKDLLESIEIKFKELDLAISSIKNLPRNIVNTQKRDQSNYQDNSLQRLQESKMWALKSINVTNN